MKLADMHVGQTVFWRGRRLHPWVITAIGKTLALATHAEGKECRLTIDNYDPIPNDLHDKDGKPLNMGDAFLEPRQWDSTTKLFVCGAYISEKDGMLVIQYNDEHNGWNEDYITKVEQQETVEDVRAWAGKIYCNVLPSDLTEAIDRTEKAVRAEFER